MAEISRGRGHNAARCAYAYRENRIIIIISSSIIIVVVVRVFPHLKHGIYREYRVLGGTLRTTKGAAYMYITLEQLLLSF